LDDGCGGFPVGDVKHSDGRTIYCRIKKVVQCGGLPVVLPLHVQNSMTRGSKPLKDSKHIDITVDGNPRAISGPFTL
jgi:hypothetical protein